MSLLSRMVVYLHKSIIILYSTHDELVYVYISANMTSGQGNNIARRKYYELIDKGA